MPLRWVSQPILKKNDILFIVDEVISGFGRLGTMFGCELYNLKPDLVSLAKALSSAYAPIGAVMISQHVVEEVRVQGRYTRQDSPTVWAHLSTQDTLFLAQDTMQGTHSAPSSSSTRWRQ